MHEFGADSPSLNKNAAADVAKRDYRSASVTLGGHNLQPSFVLLVACKHLVDGKDLLAKRWGNGTNCFHANTFLPNANRDRRRNWNVKSTRA